MIALPRSHSASLKGPVPLALNVQLASKQVDALGLVLVDDEGRRVRQLRQEDRVRRLDRQLQRVRVDHLDAADFLRAAVDVLVGAHEVVEVDVGRRWTACPG